MIPRILSITSPLIIYITLVLLAIAVWRERKKLDGFALAPAVMGLVASLYILAPVHRLFFDEDIYVNIGHNLATVPVAQVTLLGSAEDIAISTYYKEPAGWPALLSLIFLASGPGESAAFLAARGMYALTILAVYLLARRLGAERPSALVAAAVFGATPVSFWYSASAGTDIAAAFFSTVALWGLSGRNGAVAGPAIAMAAHVRMEMIVLAPLLWFSRRISFNWKAATLALIAVDVIHILWVLSVAHVLTQAEGIESAFSLSHVIQNLKADAAYLFNPLSFPTLAVLLPALSLWERAPSASERVKGKFLLLHITSLLGVYLLFYAGSFAINPRYSIQLLAPLSVLAVTAIRNRIVLALLAASLIIPHLQPGEPEAYIQTLAADHRLSEEFAAKVTPDDLVVTMEQEMYINQGVRAMSSVLAWERPERLDEELRKPGKVFYHGSARTNVEGTQAWNADQWVKSNYEIHLIDSRDIRGMRIEFYELLENFNREAR
jgi:Dolichyl-phosphate-mannose-protein mannosyltransferase